MVKQCKHERCTNQAKKGGVCIRHGGRYPAKNEPTKPSRKEYKYIQGTLQSSNDAVMEDVPSRSIKEEMEQKACK